VYCGKGVAQGYRGTVIVQVYIDTGVVQGYMGAEEGQGNTSSGVI